MKKRGVALIWVLVLSSVLVIISTTMVSYIAKESQFSVKIEQSTQAYANAKSGIEWGRWYLGKNGTSAVGSYSFNLMPEDPDLETAIEISPIAGVGYEIESISTINNVNRKLRYEILDSAVSLIPDSTLEIIDSDPTAMPVIKAPNTESFELSFRYWQKTDSLPSFRIGVSDSPIYSSTDSFIATGIDSSGTAYVNARKCTDPLAPDCFPYDYRIARDYTAWGAESATATIPYKYQFTLKYVKDTAAKYKIERIDTETVDGIIREKRVCVATGGIDLTSIDFGDLRYLHLLSAKTVFDYQIGSNLFDGSYIEKVSGAGLYIDNLYIK